LGGLSWEVFWFVGRIEIRRGKFEIGGNVELISILQWFWNVFFDGKIKENTKYPSVFFV
jgi:hypothetical protein